MCIRDSQDAMPVQVDPVLRQLLLDKRDKRQTLSKRTINKMLVQLGYVEIHKSLYPVIHVIPHQVRIQRDAKAVRGVLEFGRPVRSLFCGFPQQSAADPLWNGQLESGPAGAA